MSKVIISCAVTGSIHTPSMSPYLPVTAEEIAASALGAAEAGAAIVHLHARNPENGKPVHTPEDFAPFLTEIKHQSNVVVNITTGASPYMPVEYRVKPAEHWQPEVASLNMGSMNFGLFPMLARYKDFKNEWEPEMLEASHDLVFRNSFKDIRYALDTLNKTGIRYEFECYDTSHLYNLQYFYREGVVKGPLFIQTCHGLLEEHGLDFARAGEIFNGHHFTGEDSREDYSETRYIKVGKLDNPMVVMTWTPRGEARRIISMRKANEREQTRYRNRLD